MDAMDLIRPVDHGEWFEHPVAALADSVRNKGPDLVRPA